MRLSFSIAQIFSKAYIIAMKNIREMIAGLDLGSTLAKAVWIKDDKFQFASTANRALEEILTEMKKDGVKEIETVGLGYPKLKDKLVDFSVSYYWPDPILQEVELQARGTRKLLEQDGVKLDSFLVVSIGTGTSYTAVTADKIDKFPFGNTIGGGFLMGFSNIMGFYSYKKFSDVASKGQPLSLKMKDRVPQTEGSFTGEMIIASLGKITKETEIEDICASMIDCVATATIKDILVNSMVPGHNFENVVYVGSTLAHTPLLKDYLQKYSAMIGKNAYFPNFGEFALAMGAYYKLAETNNSSK